MSGPPIVLFGLNQEWDKDSFRANIIAYITALHVLTLILFRNFGILDTATWVLGMCALPGLLVGYVGGMRLKDRLVQEHFRKLAFALVMLGGVLALILK